MKPSKRYRKALQSVEKTQNVSLSDAFKALLKTPAVKFDETVEISAHLGVDPKQSEQMVRGTVVLPHGSGQNVRVVVFTENVQEALDAGAEHAGLDDLLQKVQGGWMDFDVAIATTSAMKQVRSVARVLGPRGLMPNPKSGTVTDNIPEAVKAVKAGRVEFKMDKTANVHVIVGKRSFSEAILVDNALAAIDALGKARPEAFKGKFISSLAVSSTMSPSVAIDSKEYNKY
jgi:large subunit ribosomal protein L1